MLAKVAGLYAFSALALAGGVLFSQDNPSKFLSANSQTNMNKSGCAYENGSCVEDRVATLTTPRDVVYTTRAPISPPQVSPAIPNNEADENPRERVTGEIPDNK